jgi:adenylate cyclase
LVFPHGERCEKLNRSWYSSSEVKSINMKRITQLFLLTVLTLLQAVAQNQNIASLTRELGKAQADTVKAKILLDIGYYYSGLGHFDSAKVALDRALILARKTQHKNIELRVLNGLGINEYYQGNNAKAKEYWQRCLAEAVERQNKIMETDVRQNLANIERDEGRYPQALKIFFECLKITEANKDTTGIRQIKQNIGIVYSLQSDFDNSMRYFLEVENSYPPGVNTPDYLFTLNNIAQAYIDMGKTADAERYYAKALTLARQAENIQIEVMALGGLSTINKSKGNYVEAFRQLESAIQFGRTMGDDLGVAIDLQRLGDVYAMAIKNRNKAFIDQIAEGNEKAGLLKAKNYTDSAINVLKANDDIENLKTAYFSLSEIEKMLGNYKAALDNYGLFTILSDSLFNIEKDKKLTQVAMQYEFDKKETTAKAAQDKKDVRSRLIRNSTASGLGGALIFLVIVYRQRNKIKAGKQRSDELLLNILPEEVAEELKAKGSAEAKQFDQVTVMFTDFKGFTQIAEKLSPAELVAEIDTCFKAFDHIIGRHNIEKIKTIGDAYMCAGGLPIANTANAVDVVRAALEIREFMLGHSKQRISAGKEVFEIRIGVHTGPVVAGIVGVKKFAYDIWGDTVNTASRMESSGVPGEVNISGSTYELVKDHFICTYRGKIPAKNKGEIDMYFASA